MVDSSRLQSSRSSIQSARGTPNFVCAVHLVCSRFVGRELQPEAQIVVLVRLKFRCSNFWRELTRDLGGGGGGGASARSQEYQLCDSEQRVQVRSWPLFEIESLMDTELTSATNIMI